MKLVSKVCADLPPEVKKIVTWGMGSYIRMLFLNKIADAKEYPTLSIAQSFSLAEEVLMIRLILHDIEENFVNEMDKLLFFCEFLSVVTTSPESIVQHAKEAKKFNYYEYSVLLEVSYRNIDHSEENKKFRQEHEDVLRVIFNKPPVNEPKSAEKWAHFPNIYNLNIHSKAVHKFCDKCILNEINISFSKINKQGGLRLGF